MTTLPTYLPGLMRDALEAGAEISVLRVGPNRSVLELIITWRDKSESYHQWTLTDGKWRHTGLTPTTATRARIKREARDGAA